MSTAAVKTYSPDEYLAFEIQSELRHEYYRGEIFLMTGGSSAHSIIKMNLGRLIGNHLAANSCVAFDADMRVKVERSELYTYPDISIACPPIEFERRTGAETLLNPVVLIEVLSPSTENYDRGKKFEHYSRIPSLREYLLVSQDEPHVEKRVRDKDGNWILSMVSDIHAAVTIESIHCVLRLDEIYAKVRFTPTAANQPQEPPR